ncbi:MAG: peptide-methionine (S)-S-oxide reductase MsrA [Chloracidobacterium sp.]|nr:peptide-methionine (S)-S-oxide reductase MsrA [Chloracidobacterium sp.]
MSIFTKLLIILTFAAGIGCSVVNSSTTTTDFANLAPTPASEKPSTSQTQTAVFAGGCFWGVEAVFEHVKGVTDVRSGYSGGDSKNADYESVSGGRTEHAESVKVTFDPAKVTYEQLLPVFFSVAHDPTQLNRQGPDTGTQYRSAIFYSSEEQKKLANDHIAAIDKSKAFPKPVVTQVVSLKEFYEAEGYHQDYLKLHPKDPYIVYHDLPKLEELKTKFPDLYK